MPLLGYVAAGAPIEAVASNETIAVPEDLVGKRDTYVLRVRGDSMIDEQIRDGDFVVVEDRKTADNGEMVIALLRGSDVTLKKFYRDPGGKIRLQPANARSMSWMACVRSPPPSAWRASRIRDTSWLWLGVSVSPCRTDRSSTRVSAISSDCCACPVRPATSDARAAFR